MRMGNSFVKAITALIWLTLIHYAPGAYAASAPVLLPVAPTTDAPAPVIVPPTYVTPTADTLTCVAPCTVNFSATSDGTAPNL